ncbi:hypothetical protein Tco_1249748, partial [Tanacetum coccineum]
MVLMVERNRGEHLIRRFVGRGNEPDPRDVKIVSLKQRIQELKFPQLQQDSPAEEAETESNVWDDGSEDVNPFRRRNLGFHDDHYDNPLLTKETESEPIIWDIGDEEEEYLFVNKYPKEESMPVYDTDIEDVIGEEKGFVGKGGFGIEEDNIEDVVVVANDLCSLMIQTILSVDFEEDINTKSHELMSFGKSIIIKVNQSSFKFLICKKYQEWYLKAPPMVDKLAFKTIKVRETKTKCACCVRGFSSKSQPSIAFVLLWSQSQPLKILWEWCRIANMALIQPGGSGRVGEMILARERSGFAG